MLSDWLIRLRSLFRRSAVERELDAELRFHVERQAEKLAASGVPPEEARRRALLALGGLDQIKEDCRDARGVAAVDAVRRDLRYGLRALASRPGLSLVILLTLALGIGANAAIFSLIDGLILRPLPVPHPEQLVTVEGPAGPGTSWTYALWDQIRQRRDLFGDAMAWTTEQYSLSTGADTDLVNGVMASGGFFRTLGVSAMLGRTFDEADDARGGGPDGPVVVISEGFWRRRYGGAPAALGQPLHLGSATFTIIGVTPAWFFGPDVGRAFDVVIPLGTEPLLRNPSMLDSRNTWWLCVMGRLRPGETPGMAEAALRGVAPQIQAAAEPPGRPQEHEAFLQATAFSIHPAATGNSALRDAYRTPLGVLLAAVGMVLLIACANIANLLLARASGRRHEMTVRLALGASRPQLVRQLLIESGLLAAGGTVLGLAFAYWTSRFLLSLIATPTSSIYVSLGPDWRVLVFTGTVATATALLFGLAPAFRATRVEATDALKEQTRTVARGGRLGVTDGLVVAQLALSLTLVVAAGLLIRTFTSLVDQPLGFDPSRLLTVRLAKPPQMPVPAWFALQQRVRDGLAGVPGVAQSAASLIVPLSGMLSRHAFDVAGAPPMPATNRAFMNGISPGWLATYGTPVLKGRDLSDGDTAASPDVALVNETFVRTYLHDADPLAATIIEDPSTEDPVSLRVVGVVADAYYQSLRETIQPTVYVPLVQFWKPFYRSVTLTVRASAGSPAALVHSVAAAIHGVDPSLRAQPAVFTDQIAGSLKQERLSALLSGFFGGVALLLAAIGLYGVMSYSVTQRRLELGIRLALGAGASRVIWATLSRVAVLVILGLAIGAVASLWASPLLAKLLFKLQPHDPATLAGAGGLLAGVSLLAAWLPARRATRIDPIEVLRQP